MSPLFDILSDRLIYATGWTLIHSIWQGLLVGLVLAGCLVIFKEQTSKFKYNISISSMFLFFAFSAMTFFHLYQQYSYRYDNTNSMTVMTTIFSSPAAAVNSMSTHSQMIGYYCQILESHIPFIVLLWSLGVFILSLRFAGGLFYVQRLKHYQTNDITQIWSHRLNELGERIHLKKSFRLIESAKIQIPVVIGFLKPVILVPAGVLTGLPAAQVDAILAHELAHIYRRDFLVNIFQSIINVIYFFHPVVWWMSSVIRSERENCCDDIALAITGDKLTLARALTTIYELNFKVPHIAMAVFRNRFHLFKRIKRLTHTRSLAPNPVNGYLAACLFIIGILILFVNAGAQLKMDYKELTTENSVMEGQIENTELTRADDSHSEETQYLFAQTITPVEKPNNPGSVASVALIDSVDTPVNPKLIQHTNQINIDKEDSLFCIPMPVFDFKFLDSIPAQIVDIDEQIIQSLKIAENVLSNFDSSYSRQFDFQFDSLVIPVFDSIYIAHIDTNCFKDAFKNRKNFEFKFDTTNLNIALKNMQHFKMNIDSIVLPKFEHFEFHFDTLKFKQNLKDLENIRIELDTVQLAKIRKKLENVHANFDTTKLNEIREKLEKDRKKLDQIRAEHLKKMEIKLEKIEKQLQLQREELEKNAAELEKIQHEKIKQKEEIKRSESEKQHESLEKKYETENRN